VELILDGGHCGTEPTTVIDLTAAAAGAGACRAAVRWHRSAWIELIAYGTH
jgi:tRNA A37 threonylcarbamoyladenosine synthetase subunit TsaC/SUA5/YrdC